MRLSLTQRQRLRWQSLALVLAGRVEKGVVNCCPIRTLWLAIVSLKQWA